MSWLKHIDEAAGGDFESWYQEEITPLVQPVIMGLIDEVEGQIPSLQRRAVQDENLDRDRWFTSGDVTRD